MLAPWKNSYDKPTQRIKKQRHYFADKDLYSQSYGFSSGHVWMWELDHKEGWALKIWCFWTIVVEKILESSLDRKEIKPVNSIGNQPWIFIERTGAKAKAPGLWPIDVKSWKRPWCWDRPRVRGEGGNRVWDGWMASRTQWTWAWASSGRQWRTGKPGMLQFMGSQRVGHNLVTEQHQQQITYKHGVGFC